MTDVKSVAAGQHVAERAGLSANAAAAGLRELAGPEVPGTPGMFVSAESLIRTWAQARRAGPHLEIEDEVIARDEVLARRFASYNRDPSRKSAEQLVHTIAQFSGRQFSENSVADSVYRIGVKLADMYRLPTAVRHGMPGYNPDTPADVRKLVDAMKSGPARASYYPPEPTSGVSIRSGK